MPVEWSPEQVLALAPDDASRKNAHALATSGRKWFRLQMNEQAIWGEFQGSGADPYRCQVDISGPAFKCSCPSKKYPCKHSLGLLLYYVSQPEKFEVHTPPDWVSAWLIKRAEQNERRAAKGETKRSAPDLSAQNKRAAERERKIRAGIEDLEIWLRDLLRQGLALAQNQPHSFWEKTASRLVDAQAPGLGRMVRDMAGIAASGEGWQSRLVSQIGRLYLAMEGYRRIDSLPETTQYDLRSVIGITQKQEEILTNPGVADTWLVMGREVEEENNFKTQRVWLWGCQTQRWGLLLSFAAAGGTLDASLKPGTALPAELVFYPSAYPLRALIRTRGPISELPNTMPGDPDLMTATAKFSAALAAHPWLERFPMALAQVTPLHNGSEWVVYDADNRFVPLAKNFLSGYTLMSLSGGYPIAMFGEWNGERLLPLSFWTDSQFGAFKPRLE